MLVRLHKVMNRHLLEEAPQGIGSEVCEGYADADAGTCNPGCPFYSECTPYFGEVARELGRLLAPPKSKSTPP